MADQPKLTPAPTPEQIADARPRMLAGRAAQGLPPRIEDAATLAELGRIFSSVEPDGTRKAAS